MKSVSAHNKVIVVPLIYLCRDQVLISVPLTAPIPIPYRAQVPVPVSIPVPVHVVARLIVVFCVPVFNQTNAVIIVSVSIAATLPLPFSVPSDYCCSDSLSCCPLYLGSF